MSVQDSIPWWSARERGMRPREVWGLSGTNQCARDRRIWRQIDRAASRCAGAEAEELKNQNYSVIV